MRLVEKCNGPSEGIRIIKEDYTMILISYMNNKCANQHAYMYVQSVQSFMCIFCEICVYNLIYGV